MRRRFVHGLAVKQLPPKTQPWQRTATPKRVRDVWEVEESKQELQQKPNIIKRNEVGVQLLNRKLHAQVFNNVKFPPPPRTFINIAREHLNNHELDVTKGSAVPDVSFTLPPLQGNTLDEHFHRIGSTAAEPWLQLSRDFAECKLPPKPEEWQLQSGWTKYIHKSDGSSYFVPVPFPCSEDGTPEEVLSFDVETLPAHTQYAIIATAVSPTAWYSWVSPWLLDQKSHPHEQLIPLGKPILVIGHNVSYDRARILEEYTADLRNASRSTRFLDTMALHIAISGISSHQRPAWMKYRKAKREAQLQRVEALDTVVEFMEHAKTQLKTERDPEVRQRLTALIVNCEETLPQLQRAVDTEEDDNPRTAEVNEDGMIRWEDITSANSLADVAKLHCGIEVDKEIRNDFMECSPEEIRDGLHNYLTYCANDVEVTQSVFSKVLPSFLKACPHPVSFAGVLTMGSSFLTVNQEWERYVAHAESTYRELEQKVKQNLLRLAEEARQHFEAGTWQDDVWLSQLDWTPKEPGVSRGFEKPVKPKPVPKIATEPRWFYELENVEKASNNIVPLLLEVRFDGVPLHWSQDGWGVIGSDGKHTSIVKGVKVRRILGKQGKTWADAGRLTSGNPKLLEKVFNDKEFATAQKGLMKLARAFLTSHNKGEANEWLDQLDWTAVDKDGLQIVEAPSEELHKPSVLWPKWYWDITKPRKGVERGTVDLTARSRFTPLLLRLSWLGRPLFHSREHGWTFRVPTKEVPSLGTHQKPLVFKMEEDAALKSMSLITPLLTEREKASGAVAADEPGEFVFFKLPHKNGESANVGSPLAKNFAKYQQDGTLSSVQHGDTDADTAKDAMEMNAQCSYWISARDRVMNQLVVWTSNPSTNAKDMVLPSHNGEEKWGIIIPQVITMGTVTRRAIEKTWLTASNAKKNRVGSELKAMVRAPPGYSIVGADVDSEELWISSVMGDAQFGIHGATAVGWMTLEGTKAAGTDLHSKTASILGISRDAAKVFNYSRIYGAGMKHAVLLLLQANPSMSPDKAKELAENLYASTKGRNTHRADLFHGKFWFGGTESYLFNKLESIALSDRPQTPVLACGVTDALSKEHLPTTFGSDYMTSRINWVVQSSGVDYLHLLIVAMQHLCSHYDIDARYLISVHDELRYLVKNEDRYRAALALQIANMWTRSLFAYILGLDDLPQSVAFFSAVDIDHVLRKEVDMPCVTPSQSEPIPPGEKFDIEQVLERTSRSLYREGQPMPSPSPTMWLPPVNYQDPNCLTHRASSAGYLQAQSTSEITEIKMLAKKEFGYKGKEKRVRSKKKPRLSALRKELDELYTDYNTANLEKWADAVSAVLEH